MISFAQKVASHNTLPLYRTSLHTLQVNMGFYCNQACHHCHVDASPKRTEMISQATVDRILFLLEHSTEIATVDLTGGAPELNPNFRAFVIAARAMNKQVIDRCNLTVLFEPNQEDLAEFLAQNDVKVVASLPCYRQENVDGQRGSGVFDKSIKALQWLNHLGYGATIRSKNNDKLLLDLVYNPTGASLPAPQKGLETSYKKQLLKDHNITFDNLFTITNMPIKRFKEQLIRQNSHHDYMQLLFDNYNESTLDGLMCRNQISIGWQGDLYDCDFNQMLEISSPVNINPYKSEEMKRDKEAAPSVNTPLNSLALLKEEQNRPTIWDIHSFDDLVNQPIALRDHCYGCTAGAGSSCGGALV